MGGLQKGRIISVGSFAPIRGKWAYFSKKSVKSNLVYSYISSIHITLLLLSMFNQRD